MITIYTFTYNEEAIIQFMIDHYRFRFPNCKIIVYDNYSTDNTVKIATSNNCQVIDFDTNNQIDEYKYLKIKNNCWKESNTDWVLVCDIDELLEIKEQDLLIEDSLGSTIIRFDGYNMVNMKDNLDISSITYGVRSLDYDKRYLFNKKYINEINYKPGCHVANPTGKKILSNKRYLAYHYKYINLDYLLTKNAALGQRLSNVNKKNYWGLQYLYDDNKTTKLFHQMRSLAKLIIV